MHVLRHDDGGVHSKPIAVVMKAMSKYEATRCVGERVGQEFTEGNEQGASLLLIMRQTALIEVRIRFKLDHAQERVRRTLLSVAFDLRRHYQRATSTPTANASDRGVRPTWISLGQDCK